MDESVKRTTIGGRRLFPIPICEIIETPLTLDRFAISVAKGETSPSIDGCQAFKVCAACFVDKSLSIGCQTLVETRRDRNIDECYACHTVATINSSSFVLDSFVVVESKWNDGMYLNIFPRFQKTIIREDSSLIMSALLFTQDASFLSLLFILNSLNSLYEI